MNIVHNMMESARHGARALHGTLILAGLCVLCADAQAPGRWFGALIAHF
ncbi:hypothetical protein [Sinimarinibacterium flocculans]